MGRFLLAYDADCGPCTNFKRVIDFLDASGKIEFMPLLVADEGGFLEGIPPALRHRSFHLISPDGALSSGAEAIPRLIAALPSGRLSSWLVTSAPGGISTVVFIYSVFSRLHASESCGYSGLISKGSIEKRPCEERVVPPTVENRRGPRR